MQTRSINYPDVPWKSGWKFTSGPTPQTPFLAANPAYSLTVANGNWSLQLAVPDLFCSTRLFYNGFSLATRKRPEKNRIDALVTQPGVLCGSVEGLPMPKLNSTLTLHYETGCTWLTDGSGVILLLQHESRFILVFGEQTMQRALAKAQSALDGNFETLLQTEIDERQKVCQLFSMNTRHNPPVALATETLYARLRERNQAIYGLWSLADGYSEETFSLNELYPLTRAWCIIDPPVALELIQTALSLQQSSGGFPAWISANGPVSQSSAWPLLAQSFELAWHHNGADPLLLKKHLPALRKYLQWALRRFDPHRDRIPSWQSEQEIFVPGSFERDKATPDLTVFLLTEMDSVLRLCSSIEHADAAVASLTEDREHLVRALNTVFWDPAAKAFSNVWKSGHFIHEPSFGSFLPLLWQDLDKQKQTALLENFEETNGFPGQQNPESWKQDELTDTVNRPVIHQFMAFEAIRSAQNARGLLMRLVHRMREGFSTWFERESLEAIRGKVSSGKAYELGPVTSALILSVQSEFEKEASYSAPTTNKLLQLAHRWRIRKADLYIVLISIILMIMAHMAYTIHHSWNTDSRIAEALLDYREGRFAESLRICRSYPDHPVSQFLHANLLMLSEQPKLAKDLYRKALTQAPSSPSALFGYALALHMSGDFKQAEKRYVDFLDLYEYTYPEEAQLADTYRMLAQEQFSKPHQWKRVFERPFMNDLGL
ncbi:MAG: hypothetical protein FJ220_01430 [Kiritimatiellaceae bacterium]|nr:hypothetical protein [Kiritimatiellaceae bacterium]